jgi:hypothetical protein
MLLPRASTCWLSLATVVLLVASGCASRVEVLGGAQADFSGLHTWAWDAGGVQVESVSDRAGIGDRVRALVEEQLAERGFQRSDVGAALLVTAVVSVERRERWVRTAIAPYLMDSYHSSASYWIEGSAVERRTFEDLRIGLAVRRAGRDTAWRAITGDVVDGSHGLPVPRLVSALLDQLPGDPSASPVPAPDGGPLAPVERIADLRR